MSESQSKQERKIFSQIYPVLGLFLVFLGPFFFFQSLSFLRIIDYTAAILCFLAGWSLLRAGIDITRAVLASLPSPHPKPEPSRSPESSPSEYTTPQP